MSGKLTALRAHLRTSTQEAREAKAAELYELEKLRLILTGRASAGFEHAVIDAPDGLDLRTTAAALAALEWLEREKLATKWEARTGGEGSDGTRSHSLHVSWKPPALAVAD